MCLPALTHANTTQTWSDLMDTPDVGVRGSPSFGASSSEELRGIDGGKPFYGLDKNPDIESVKCFKSCEVVDFFYVCFFGRFCFFLLRFKISKLTSLCHQLPQASLWWTWLLRAVHLKHLTPSPRLTSVRFIMCNMSNSKSSKIPCCSVSLL